MPRYLDGGEVIPAMAGTVDELLPYVDELKQLIDDPVSWAYARITDKQGRAARELRARVRADVVRVLVEVAAVYIVGSALSGPARAGRRKS